MQEDKKDIIDTEKEFQPTLAKGNYLIEIADENGVIKKIAVANSEINITQLKDGGFTVDL